MGGPTYYSSCEHITEFIDKITAIYLHLVHKKAQRDLDIRTALNVVKDELIEYTAITMKYANNL